MHSPEQNVPLRCKEELQELLSRTSPHSITHNICELAKARGVRLPSEPTADHYAYENEAMVGLRKLLHTRPVLHQDESSPATILVELVSWLASVGVASHYLAATLGVTLDDVQNGVIADILAGNTDHRPTVATMLFGVGTPPSLLQLPS